MKEEDKGKRGLGKRGKEREGEGRGSAEGVAQTETSFSQIISLLTQIVCSSRENIETREVDECRVEHSPPVEHGHHKLTRE